MAELVFITADDAHRKLAAKKALLGCAFYPVSVRRPAVSLPASSRPPVARTPLRFSSLAVVNSWEDLHLQDGAHAGRTMKKAEPMMALL